MKNILSYVGSNPTFIDVLQKRLELSANKKAFTFLRSDGNITLTYFELDRKIRRVAAFLQQQNLRGERALLLYPPGLDYIVGYFGCIYAGVIAVPVYPPDPSSLKKTLPRIQSIAKDSRAIVALSSQHILDDVKNWKNELAEDKKYKMDDLFNLKWIATDNLTEKIEDDWKNPNITSDYTAYLQYTSGSTGTPKGVIINHANLVHNTNMIFHGFEIKEEEDVEIVIWLPIYHDMGLIGGILEPIFCGSHCTIISPIDFLKRPYRWLQTISNIKNKPVVSGGPNFAYELCIRSVNSRKAAELDLSNWEIAFSGAEPVRAETINKFAEVFKSSGFKKKAFYPCYGLAEGTLIVSGSRREAEPVEITIDKELLKKNKIVETDNSSKNKLTFVSSGEQLFDGNIKTVNTETKKICSENEVGEIWSLSKSNAQGYYNKNKLSKETFQAYPSDSDEGPFLRTGDLGFLKKGKLFVTGRLKDLVIINGSNHYPQDIEATVENSNKLLRPGSTAAFSVDINNEEKLVLVQEARAKQNVNWEDVVLDIRNEIFETHNIHAYEIVLIKPHTIFKTSSGKIRRKDTKNAYLNNTLEIIYNSENMVLKNDNYILSKQSVSNNVEKKTFSNKEIIETITERISRIINIPVSQIDINQPFVTYGIDSAKSLGLVGEIEEFVDRPLAATLLWDYPTIQKLADYLAGNEINNNDDDKKENSKIEKNFIDEVSELTEKEAEELLMKKLGLD